MGLFRDVPGVFRGVPGCSGFYRHPHFVTHFCIVATVHCLSDFGGTESNQGFTYCP